MSLSAHGVAAVRWALLRLRVLFSIAAAIASASFVPFVCVLWLPEQQDALMAVYFCFQGTALTLLAVSARARAPSEYADQL